MDGNRDGNPIEVVFFDIRDTLGEVDRPGHLEPYRPSTEKLLSAMKDVIGLRIGVITNLPDNVSAADGHKLLEDAVLSIDPKTNARLTIKDFIDPKGIIINHDAGINKPDPEIFKFAARQMGVPVERCIFVGENLIECLGAKTAGMQTQLKPVPPGREFQPAPLTRMETSATDSGRAFEHFFEHEHLLGDRIFKCGETIVEKLKALNEGERIPDDVYTAMALLIYLTNNFADQAHLKAEEAVIPLAVARGMDPKSVQWVYDHHDQGRAYFRAMDIAWRRIELGDPADLPFAIDAFWRCTEGFVKLFIHHAERENNELYPGMGRHFSDTDDTLIINLIGHIGPPDFTPYVGIVSAMEQALGMESPA